MDLIEATREEIGTVAAQLARSGWAEANAGNISVLLPSGSDSSIWDGEVMTEELPVPIPELSGRTFMITTAGSRFRKLISRMDTEIIPVRVSADGMKVIRLAADRQPTTEFSTHVLVLAQAAGRGWDTASLVHTHSTHMLALSSSDLPAEMLEDAVNRSHPEISLLMKRGVRFLDFMTPGTWELGIETAAAFRESDCVIWRKHGILGLGRDLDAACDAVEVVEKAARLLLLERSAFGKFVGLKDRDLMLQTGIYEGETDEQEEDETGLPPGPPVIES
ncbi:MAG: class II aldolase/adducin family protein [Candidatus Fermentibacteraceae bacterium]|nr:class II aldolase/adducin family protein [Candidatus Fermentibacteraceae bacterium]MBN2607529.1 class II aldolase/adducin family protein [Candidatus Fermentibacteraceae bacterium]